MQPDVLDEDPHKYDFFNSDNKQQPQGSPPSLKRRLIIVSLAGTGLLIVFWVAFGLIFGGEARTTELVVRVAQRQNELIRLSDLGARNASTESASALATNTKLSVQTSQIAVNQILRARERPLSTSERRALQSTEANELLEEATRAGNFDVVFVQILRDNLRTYQEELTAAHRALSLESERQVLEEAHEDARILLMSN